MKYLELNKKEKDVALVEYKKLMSIHCRTWDEEIILWFNNTNYNGFTKDGLLKNWVK